MELKEIEISGPLDLLGKLGTLAKPLKTARIGSWF